MLFSLTSFLGSKDINGRLEMSNVQLGHRGSYDCKAVDYPMMPGSKVSVFLEVIRKSELFHGKNHIKFDIWSRQK